MPTPEQLDRAQGCLLGQLAGDTLGGLVEFCSPAESTTLYPSGVREMQDGGRWGNIAGQPTDDSEMALALARTIVRDGKYDESAALEAYLKWWHRAWDRGSTISQSLQSAAAAALPRQRLANAKSCSNRDSQSNGSLMRSSPIGIFAAGASTTSAWHISLMDSRLTHPNPVCGRVCWVYVIVLSRTIAEGLSGQEAYDLAETYVNDCRGTKLHQALQDAATKPPEDYVSQMGWILIAFQNALYQLLHAASIEDGIVDTIGHGGDTDTNAAIAGALLGAVHGRRAVPERWIATLQNCRPNKASGTRHPMPETYWPCDVLELAEKLLLAGETQSQCQ